MESNISQRYTIGNPIVPLTNGIIYHGTDSMLNRDVFLYAIENVDDDFAMSYIRKLRRASQVTDDNFMHMLDLGYDSSSNQLLAVLKPYTGCLLVDHVKRQAFSLREGIQFISKLISTMESAEKEGMIQFSVAADNLWMTDEKHMMIVNYWEQVAESKRGVRGLCNLLYQLITGSSKVPQSWEEMASAFHAGSFLLPESQRPDFIQLIKHASSVDFPVPAFKVRLQQYLLERAETRQTEREQPRGEDDVEHALRLMKRQSEPRVEQKPAVKVASTTNSEPPVANKKVLAAEVVWEENKERRSVSDIMKRLLLIGGTAAVVFVLGGLVLMGLINSGKPNREETQTIKPSPAPVTSSQPSNTTPSSPVSTDAPKDTTKNETASTVSPNATTVEAPVLMGLAREEAEKRALAAGLRYSYVIEATDQAAPGTIFRQEPQSGMTVPKGSTIKFWVSKAR